MTLEEQIQEKTKFDLDQAIYSYNGLVSRMNKRMWGVILFAFISFLFSENLVAENTRILGLCTIRDNHLAAVLLIAVSGVTFLGREIEHVASKLLIMRIGNLYKKMYNDDPETIYIGEMGYVRISNVMRRGGFIGWLIYLIIQLPAGMFVGFVFSRNFHYIFCQNSAWIFVVFYIVAISSFTIGCLTLFIKKSFLKKVYEKIETKSKLYTN